MSLEIIQLPNFCLNMAIFGFEMRMYFCSMLVNEFSFKKSGKKRKVFSNFAQYDSVKFYVAQLA